MTCPDVIFKVVCAPAGAAPAKGTANRHIKTKTDTTSFHFEVKSNTGLFINAPPNKHLSSCATGFNVFILIHITSLSLPGLSPG
ncbi:MAG: hypothetical protein BWY80_00995 [Firmicutes bacterium ADurb.Bin456]|nr:MAG: hypothetical protein BWY80_00995 [Firmicutes bacterium ADurb.Bin456]